MSHCDETTLALAALGEEIPADEAAHLQSCDVCTAEVAELLAIVTLGREAPAELPEVPDHVWAGIRQELSLVGAPDGGNAVHPPLRSLPPMAPTPDVPTSDSTVVPMQRRRTRGAMWGGFAVAAAAGALVGGTVVWSAVERGDAGVRTTEQIVAQAVLAPLTESVAEPGQATVLDSPDGTVVRVDASSLPANDGFYEVWLLDAEATKLVALGALPAGSIGTFTVPPGLSIEEYPVVDISLESYDGDPSHSKKSLMRGALEA
jgi:hypothetical protein